MTYPLSMIFYFLFFGNANEIVHDLELQHQYYSMVFAISNAEMVDKRCCYVVWRLAVTCLRTHTFTRATVQRTCGEVRPNSVKCGNRAGNCGNRAGKCGSRCASTYSGKVELPHILNVSMCGGVTVSHGHSGCMFALGPPMTPETSRYNVPRLFQNYSPLTPKILSIQLFIPRGFFKPLFRWKSQMQIKIKRKLSMSLNWK